MKVKIGNVIYDSTKQPILLLLSKEDKFNISHMLKKALKYCSYSSSYNKEKVIEFMKD